MRHKKIYLLLAMIGATSACTVANENQVKASSKSPVYRLYNPNSGEHFYTTNFYEGNSLKMSVGLMRELVGKQQIQVRQFIAFIIQTLKGETTIIP